MQDRIRQNARLIRAMHDRVHETYAKEAHGPEHTKACEEFQARYDSLAFPGGYEAGMNGIAQGDPDAWEAAICFLEVEPYFFQSQYIKKKLTRRLKRAALSKSQRMRLDSVLSRQKSRAKPPV